MREYVIKLGERPNTKLAYNKYLETKELFEEFELIVPELNTLVNKSSKSDWEVLHRLADDIISLRHEIKNLVTYIPSEEESSYNSGTQQPILEPRMRSYFDIKTAIALVTVMNGHENVTKQLIDVIQLYITMIEDKHKQALINFVLKTRLSQSAKLRLQSAYAIVDDLIVDMKKHLIQKKSAVALQS